MLATSPQKLRLFLKTQPRGQPCTPRQSKRRPRVQARMRPGTLGLEMRSLLSSVLIFHFFPLHEFISCYQKFKWCVLKRKSLQNSDLKYDLKVNLNAQPAPFRILTLLVTGFAFSGFSAVFPSHFQIRASIPPYKTIRVIIKSPATYRMHRRKCPSRCS